MTFDQTRTDGQTDGRTDGWQLFTLRESRRGRLASGSQDARKREGSEARPTCSFKALCFLNGIEWNGWNGMEWGWNEMEWCAWNRMK